MMMTAFKRPVVGSLILFALLAPAVHAQPKKKKDLPKVEGRLIVEDGAGMFSPEAIKKAKAIIGEVTDVRAREMDVVTFKTIAAAKKPEFDKMNAEERSRFFADWAHDEAKASKAHGVFVFICRAPGHILVMVDKELRDKAFTAADEQRIRDLMLDKLREAAKAEKDQEKLALRDKGLINAAEYVRDVYKKLVK